MVLHLYKNKKSDLLSALTFNDATFWGADAFVGVVFALYITQNISGGTAIDVGLVFGLYRIVRAFAAIPIGRYLDEHKSHLDEYHILLFSGLLVGLTYMSLFFSTALWHVYIGIIFIGFGHALNIGSWKILFYTNIPENSEGKIIGIYETFMQLVYGLTIVVAGFVGELFGFEWTFFFAGVMTILSSGILLFIRHTKKDL